MKMRAVQAVLAALTVLIRARRLMPGIVACSTAIVCGHALALQTAPPALSSSNIGFMKHPPTQARKNFPMCDEFLDVQWIDKKKKVGLTRIDLYEQYGEKLKPITALVYLGDQWPRFDYDFSEALETASQRHLIALIKEGTITERDADKFRLSFKTRDGKKAAFTAFASKNISGGETLANGLKTVCVQFPELKRVWLAERRQDAPSISEADYKIVEMGNGTYAAAIPSTDNKGFVRNPPASLKKRFPMCDSFLAVEWIDREKRIGLSDIDLYMPDGTKDTRRSLALIHLDKNFPKFTYDFGAALKKHSRAALYAAIRSGAVQPEHGMVTLTIATSDSGELAFHSFSYSRDYLETLADERKNVCIPFPGNERMWLAETRRPSTVYDQKTLKRKANEIRASIPDFKGPPIPPEFDINHDGKMDFFSGDLIYSHGGRYYSMVQLWKSMEDSDYANYSFPHTTRICALEESAHFLTTDGYSYFLNDQCNLTELTKEGMQR